MTYYKIVRNGTVIDANITFLKWNAKHHCLFVCDVEDAELVQSFDLMTLYHDDWLKPVPSAVTQYENADVIVIGATEYDEIRAQLDDGETIINEPEPQIISEPESDSQQDDTPAERPMTVAEMRQIITEQQEQIAMLTDCLLEMSEVVYGE